MASRDFYPKIISFLMGESFASIHINMELDVWRFVTHGKGKASLHEGHMLYEKNDFANFNTLPRNWFYTLDEHGQGATINFPIKAKPVLLWSDSHYYVNKGQLQKAPEIPIEEVCLTICRKACSLENLNL